MYDIFYASEDGLQFHKWYEANCILDAMLQCETEIKCMGMHILINETRIANQ